MSGGDQAGLFAAYRGLPRGIWVLAGVGLVNRAGTMVVPFLSLYLQESLGLSAEALASLLFLFGVGALAGAGLGGFLVHRLGVVATMHTSLVGVSVAFVGFSYARDELWLGVGIFAIGCIGDAFRPAMMAAVGQYAPPGGSARAMALGRSAVNAGMVMGPAAGGFLAVHDYDWLFWVDAATSIGAAAALAAWLPRRSRPLPSAAPPIVDRPRHGHSFTGEPARPWYGDLPFLAFLALSLVVALCFFQAIFTLPLFLHEAYDYPEDAIGSLLAIQAATIVCFEMLIVHRLADRSAVLLFGAGGLLTGVGLGMVGLSGSMGLIAAAMIVWSFGEMLSMPFGAALVAERAGPSRMGAYMSLYNAVFAVAQIAAPVVGLGIRELWGWWTLWIAVAACGGVVCIGSMALAKRFEPTSS